jgi:pimeloyl-ACP methyl ester carboxylesterase
MMRRLGMLWFLLAAACAPAAPPGAIGGIGWAFAPAPDHAHRGAAEAAGVVVFAHGRGGRGEDYRGLAPQPWVARFAEAGFDVTLFDRHPASDETDRAAGWLREGLARLRAQGYRRIVVAGHSRGGWNALQVLDTPGLADVVIAIAAAAHGQGGSMNLNAQVDQLRAMVARAPPSDTRVAFVQFEGDPFVLDPDGRAALLRDRLAPRVGALLLIDRPKGLAGHAAGYSRAFADRFGACLVAFATAADPPRAC